MPSKKSGKNRRAGSTSRSNRGDRLYGPPPLVSFTWLLGAAATAVAIGAAGAYLVLCVIFYQNQAMMIFHPSRKVKTTPASIGLAYQQVAFNQLQNSQLQLTGWWIPATKDAPYGNATILYLHGASGSLSDTVPTLKALHSIGVNVFAIDYEGFGSSGGTRPTEQLADRDTLAAWNYLTKQKDLPPTSIVIFGKGAGATFATHLAAQRKVAGLVLAEISPTAHTIFMNDQRARLLPLFLLAKEKMNPAPELAKLNTPKLFLDWTEKKSGIAQNVTKNDFRQAASPKLLTSLPEASPAKLASAIQPFLGQILSTAH